MITNKNITNYFVLTNVKIHCNKILDNNKDNELLPYSCYNEKFENFKTHKIRKHTINLYMPEINKIIQIAKSKGFYIKDKKSLESIGLPNEYLFVLKKYSLFQKILSFEINSKKKIILVSLKKNIKSYDLENLGAKFYDLYKELKQKNMI